MTDRAKLMELAARVEALSGPDRGVDADIAVAVNANSLRGARKETADEEVRALGYVRHLFNGGKSIQEAKPYTASLDAAMSLVPEGDGRWPQIEYIGPNPNNAEQGHRWRIWFQMRGRECGHSLASSALALTAAALRARAEQEQSK